jgi:hypothetical protein
MTGTVKAKVRRILEEKFDQAWSFALFYVDNLELQPTSAFTIYGPIQTNSTLYIGTSNFTAATATATSQTSGKVTYSGDYVNGYAPLDSSHTGTITKPHFPSTDPLNSTIANEPPMQVAPYLPFGWDVVFDPTNINTASNYHELIERATGTDSGTVSAYRFYNQAGIRILIPSGSTTALTVKYLDTTGVEQTAATGSTLYNAVLAAIPTTVAGRSSAIYDTREVANVRLTTVDIGVLKTKIDTGLISNFNGIIYISDVSYPGTVTGTLNGATVNCTARGIRLKNATQLPNPASNASMASGYAFNNVPGLTIACENPAYIQGDYNTGSSSPATNSSVSVDSTTSPTASGYTRQPAAIVADAVTLLSAGFVDSTSVTASSSVGRPASANVTVNAALVSGITPTTSAGYSGGAENFVRFMEDWSSKRFTYYGSMMQLFSSVQATGRWVAGANVYKQPTMNWFYDTNLQTKSPPGNFSIASYLQQQRWYQVY